jgi:undecaprenyl-diphosphatase
LSLFEALILGLVQGVTEFLPISSSAHLQLTRWFLGVVETPSLQYFDLTCHAGTVFALLIYLRKQIASIFTSLHCLANFSLALLPLIPIYLLLKPLKNGMTEPYYMGYGLLFTSLLFFFTSKYAAAPQFSLASPLSASRLKWQDMLCIGVMQTLALMPGISRSGSTMAAARLRGWSWMDAAHFSFLLAAPSILGGECLETLKLMKATDPLFILPCSCYAIGFLSAFSFGLLTIRWIFQMYQTFNAIGFAYYCAAVGLLALSIFHA